jgi:hypothetical protein
MKRLLIALNAARFAWKVADESFFQREEWTAARCGMNPFDLAVVKADERGAVAIGAYEAADDKTNVVILCPSHARAFAAAILNAADRSDGTTPLLFLPDGPEEPDADYPAVIGS